MKAKLTITKNGLGHLIGYTLSKTDIQNNFKCIKSELRYKGFELVDECDCPLIDIEILDYWGIYPSYIEQYDVVRIQFEDGEIQENIEDLLNDGKIKLNNLENILKRHCIKDDECDVFHKNDFRFNLVDKNKVEIYIINVNLFYEIGSFTSTDTLEQYLKLIDKLE